jgi:rifampicin phosphotransferase
MNQIVAIREAAALGVEQVGAKTTNLARLVAAGLPVPRAYCVPAGLLDNLVPSDCTESSSCQGTESAQLWERLAAIISDNALGQAVAVRSSATIEDSVHASYAGHFHTGFTTKSVGRIYEEILRAVQQFRQVIGHACGGATRGPSRLALLIQRLVPAEISGVAFMYDPVRLRPDRVLIEASWGLGTATVDAKVRPDLLILDSQDGHVLQETRGRKRSRWDFDLATEQIVCSDVPLPEQACLHPEHLRRLWQLLEACQKQFDTPQDIEWAIDTDGEIWILQSRPIASLQAASSRSLG